MASEPEEQAAGKISPPAQDNTPLAVDDNAVPQDGDDVDSTIGFDNTSDTTSLSSSILAYREENGRTYHAYKDGVYVLPNDETQNERLDLQHNLLLLTFDGKLHCAPLDKPFHRVLDAGCGTGIWSIDFADEHPECQVTGIDLSPIQPPFVPPNVSFYVDDLEDDWTFSTKFDFIFSRFMTGSIRNWPRYLKQCYEFLEPGGTLELVDIIYPLISDDGTLKEEHPARKWSVLLQEGFAAGGHPLTTALYYKDWLKDAGFVDVVEVKEKWPVNAWARNPKYKQVGMWVYENSMQVLEPLSLAIFTRPKGEGGLGWSLEELQVLLAGVRKDFKNLGIHMYSPVYSVYANKPK
ncbi:S-adenosyl-L-methionine-dependent methyltransferase [Dactylonectria macrodidyma]|uniref:S-adenosyl-L-methionine-dependent methyltransferase n=1 Tax=Dactylonectria macrodidyma TaxID=307937 RepID=A0A9P9IMQ1_9HYPO|nr:S-adenosyl-L-methionine-dependent methyltransferase [Dactylonectria macrodidyma]